MACPHVAGVAAYPKTFHPEWYQPVNKSHIHLLLSCPASNIYADNSALIQSFNYTLQLGR
ncbi:predicted protein [Arabidopsis lyrata subsp. lyrata]|uniref:Predicted protein n=1 Tax=Arabidopsis lyrata subsp. lyrata TaxID=81972 RepID=D7MPN3_ARALL|nr:predicted protein [Arabidopsis lyrata subsp. lyrata]